MEKIKNRYEQRVRVSELFGWREDISCIFIPSDWSSSLMNIILEDSRFLVIDYRIKI